MEKKKWKKMEENKKLKKKKRCELYSEENI
jgi:hypothetical protein